MKSQIVEYYGLYNGDDRGYNIGPPISIWPIKAAAESKRQNYYQNVYLVKILKIEDSNYIFKKVVDKKSFSGAMKTFSVVSGYYEHIYENGRDNSRYYCGNKYILELLKDGKYHNLRRVFLISDGENIYEIEFPDEVKIEKLVPSRELAISHALSKLTEEEKGLLGLK